MNNLEDNLRKIKTKELTKEDRESLWHSIMVGRTTEGRTKSRLLGFNIFNFSMKKTIVGFIALVLVLGGGGMVVASNSATPGSLLFPVELALENMQLKLSGDARKSELRLRFAEERLEEIREVSEKRSIPINFSDDESRDVSRALSDIDEFLNANGDGQNKEELRKSLLAILALLGDDGKLEVRKEDGRIKIETKDGEVKIKVKSEDSRKSSDDDSKSDDDKDRSSDDSSLNNNDVREDDSEVFCRGEWRDPEDCDDNGNDNDDDDEDNSGHGGGEDD